MSKLDQLRAKLAAEKPVELPLNEGHLAASLRATDTSQMSEHDRQAIRNRFLMEACLACGNPHPTEIGLRHGGIHYRCSKCTFEHTRKTFTGEEIEQAKKHLELLVDASIRFTADILKDQERKELYANARREYRKKWNRLLLPTGDLDAELLFGQHKGKLISDMADDRAGRDYLRWILSAEFDEELKRIIQMHIANTDGR